MLDKKMNLRRDSRSHGALDEILEVMAGIMANRRLGRNAFCGFCGYLGYEVRGRLRVIGMFITDIKATWRREVKGRGD